jgi:hypothetical protein
LIKVSFGKQKTRVIVKNSNQIPQKLVRDLGGGELALHKDLINANFP